MRGGLGKLKCYAPSHLAGDPPRRSRRGRKPLGGGLHGGGFHGRFPGGGFPVAGSPSGGSGGGVVYGGHFHDDGFAFHRNMRRSRDLLVVYGYGYNCGFGLDCGVYISATATAMATVGAAREMPSAAAQAKRRRLPKQRRRLCSRPLGAEFRPELSQFVLGPPSRIRSSRRFRGASPDRPMPSLG